MDRSVYQQFLRYVHKQGGQLPCDGPWVGSKEYELWVFIENTLIYREHEMTVADVPLQVWHAEESVKDQFRLIDWSNYSTKVEQVETVFGVAHDTIAESTEFHHRFTKRLLA